MTAAVLFAQILWTSRLACWPLEVEGQGQEPAPTQAQGAPAAVPEGGTLPPAAGLPLPAPPPLPVAVPLPASLPLFQEARYDIRYGLLGSVGSLSFSVGGVVQNADGSRLVKVAGAGTGAVLGMGTLERRIEAEFDPVTLQSRRWTIVRLRNGQGHDQATKDTGARAADGGALVLERTKPGQAPQRQTVTFAVPTSDPLGLLWRLRTAPPAPGRTEIVHLMDGLALWRVRVTSAPAHEILADMNRTAIRFDGELAPIFYDGRADDSRPTRRFTLWLSDATDHLPLRLEVPVGLADVVMTLADTRGLAPVVQPAPRQVTGPVPGARSL